MQISDHDIMMHGTAENDRHDKLCEAESSIKRTIMILMLHNGLFNGCIITIIV
jgi:hypothetical protein